MSSPSAAKTVTPIINVKRLKPDEMNQPATKAMSGSVISEASIYVDGQEFHQQGTVRVCFRVGPADPKSEKIPTCGLQTLFAPREFRCARVLEPGKTNFEDAPMLCYPHSNPADTFRVEENTDPFEPPKIPLCGEKEALIIRAAGEEVYLECVSYSTLRPKSK